MKRIFHAQRLCALGAAGIVTAIGGALHAAPPMSKMTGSAMHAKPMVAAGDKTFAMKAAQGGAGEVMLGKLAMQNGSSPSVKMFGQHMVTDHSAANAKLKKTASALGLSLPDGPGPKEKATYARLAKLHGAAFDSAYKKDMIEDHHMDIADFTKEATTGKTLPIKSFAATTLPTLKSHLQMAEQMSTGVKATQLRPKMAPKMTPTMGHKM